MQALRILTNFGSFRKKKLDKDAKQQETNYIIC